MKVVIFAANGYIGRVLTNYYADKKAEVVAITRSPFTYRNDITNLIWDGKNVNSSWTKALDGASLVINLAGKSVNCRYSEKNKKEIFDSRINATQAIAEAIQQCSRPPELWINSASATIYRHAEDKPMDEINGEIGTGFSVEVCKKWEKIFFETNTKCSRKIALRMAIVLGKNDGAFKRLQNMVKAGLGGRQGKGTQMFSWIHDFDLCNIMDFLVASRNLEGVYNAASPHPITNARLMNVIRNTMKVSFRIPSPKWLLKIGAFLIGTETELILKSRWVVPTKLLNAGFIFEYPEINTAVTEIIKPK